MKRGLLLLLLLLFSVTGCQKPQPSPQPQVDIVQPVAPPPPPVTTRLTLAAVGDIMVHSYQYKEAWDPVMQQYDFSHNFTDVTPVLSAADIAIGNLETTFGGTVSDFPQFSTPDSFADAIKDAGFDLLTTANNHSMDTGASGVRRTLDVLDTVGISHVGTARDETEQNTLVIKEINGITLAFLSYTYGTNGLPVPEPYLVNLMTEEGIRADIQAARTQADFVIVLPHMGNEYETTPRQVFVDWVDMMFEAGADIVLASHPHVLQPMEYRTLTNPDGSTRTGFVIYSLGNFISSQTTPPRNASIILQMALEKTGEETEITEVSYLPIWTQFSNAQRKNHFVVRSVYDMLTLSEEERAAVLRPKDYQRLLEIHTQTNQTMLGEVPDLQPSYVFPKS